MEKNFEVSNLLDFYGDLLTENQKQTLCWYYNEDLSLSEIAYNRGITRQAVQDNIKRAELQLYDFEKKLQLLKKFMDMKNCFFQIIDFSHQIKILIKDKNSKAYKLADLINNKATSACEM